MIPPTLDQHRLANFIGREGGAELVNYRARQNYYIVDRLFAAAELRLGADKQQKVRIVRTDGRPR